MATEGRPLFDFYFRYKWNEVDFADWQDTMIGTLRDTVGAIFGPSLIAGGAVAPSGSTRAVTVAAYETINEDGYLGVRNSTVLASVTANSNPRKDLIVARPLLVNQTTIVRPTSPFDTVPFHVGQDTEIVVIAGTPAGSPAYPAKADGDVIIAGLAVANGATSFSAPNIDTTITELISSNNNFADWVVGKDTHGTAEITGDSSSVRAALTLSGGNGQAALSAAIGDILAEVGDIIAQTGNIVSAARITATTGVKFKISGNGSDVMDGYRSGSFTPSVVADGSNSVTMSQQSATFTRIGNLVFVQGTVVGNTGASTGNLVLTGLPYKINHGATRPVGLAQLVGAYLNTAYNTEGRLISIDNTTTAYLEAPAHASSGAGSDIGNAFNASQAMTFRFTATYITTDAF